MFVVLSLRAERKPQQEQEQHRAPHGRRRRARELTNQRRGRCKGLSGPERRKYYSPNGAEALTVQPQLEEMRLTSGRDAETALCSGAVTPVGCCWIHGSRGRTGSESQNGHAPDRCRCPGDAASSFTQLQAPVHRPDPAMGGGGGDARLPGQRGHFQCVCACVCRVLDLETIPEVLPL